MISLKLLSSGHRVCKRLSLEPFKRSLSALPGSLEDSYFRTDEVNPAKHDTSHLGRIYTVDPEVPKLFGKELNPKENYNANNYFAPRGWVDRYRICYVTPGLTGVPLPQVQHPAGDCHHGEGPSPANHELYQEHRPGQPCSEVHSLWSPWLWQIHHTCTFNTLWASGGVHHSYNVTGGSWLYFTHVYAENILDQEMVDKIL